VASEEQKPYTADLQSGFEGHEGVSHVIHSGICKCPDANPRSESFRLMSSVSFTAFCRRSTLL
jgi:hypothetical protein